jgi:hypothetical protein
MERVYKAALALGTANQLTNILRDVGEDARERNRIYVPMQELRDFGISEEEVSRRGKGLCVGLRGGGRESQGRFWSRAQGKFWVV